LAALVSAATFASCGCKDEAQSAGSASSKNPAVSQPPEGLAKETWEYWDAMHKAAIADDGPETLADLKVGENISAEDLIGAAKSAAEVEVKRCRTIAALPVLHVDPELTEYAAQYVQSHLMVTSLIDEFAAIASHANDAMSGPHLAGSFLLNLMQHANDKDGVFWNAATSQMSDTASELKRLKPLSDALTARVAAADEARTNLRVAEMRVRSRLAQKFSKEFPSIATYGDAKPATVLAEPTAAELQSDLAARTLNASGRMFDAPNQIVSFKVVKSEMASLLVTVHEVQVTIKGKRTRLEFPLRLRMIYHRFGQHWKFTEVEENR
jgi:hypothetical protein